MSGTITPAGGTGLTSEMSVRLHHVAAYHREHGELPAVIDGSKQFEIYRDADGEDVSAKLFGPVEKVEVECTDYNHGWQYAWLDETGLANLSAMARAACAPSEAVAVAEGYFYNKICGRTAVIYRGNDKVKEIPSVNYEIVAEMARDTGSRSFIVQTDERNFYDFFRGRFPDSVHYENFPMLPKSDSSYVLPARGGRIKFAVEFSGALRALARADKLLVLAGNVGHWCGIFRGRLEGLWQAHGREQRWRRLG